MQTEGEIKQQSYHEIKAEAENIAKKVINENLGDRVYHPKDSQAWTNNIAEKLISEMRAFNANFKHIVTCIILQKGESGLSLTSTCFWNS